LPDRSLTGHGGWLCAAGNGEACAAIHKHWEISREDIQVKEQFYVLELDEEYIVISITDRGARIVRRGYNSRQEALDAFPQAA
jgi:hypothetical protein